MMSLPLFRSFGPVFLALALGGCSASVTTFGGEISPSPMPTTRAEAERYCAAEIKGGVTTHEIAIGPDGGLRTTRERMNLCLERFVF